MHDQSEPRKSIEPETTLREEYDAHLPTYEALKQEIVFILSQFSETENVKVHNIESRVKRYESAARKLASREANSISDINDIVGCRLICLFKSDLKVADKYIRSFFDVISVDDKTDISADSFGYMSIHYICEMKRSYNGPRYKKISGLRFEIQVRTLCMNAWAAISHYLDYKTEWDIPPHLKKGLNALSALFYVADEQYEHLFLEREKSRAASLEASSEKDDAEDEGINLDSLSALLTRLFPDRKRASPSAQSQLISELAFNRYGSIHEVERDIMGGLEALEEDEIARQRRMGGEEHFAYNEIGAARVAIRSFNRGYEQIVKIPNNF